MPDVAAAVEAGPAGASLLQRLLIDGMAGIAQTQGPPKRVDQRVASAAGGQDAVKHVDAGRHRGDDVLRLADTHEIPRFFGREMGHGRRQRRHHRLRSLPHRESAHRIACKRQRPQRLGTFPAQIALQPPLHDPKQRLIRSAVRGEAAICPAERSPHRVLDCFARRRQRDHMIQLHGDIGANALLNPHRRLGGEFDRAAIEVRAKKGPLLRHPHLLGQAENLKSTAVGERGTTPAHEASDSPCLGDHFLTGAQVEMVGVLQHHAGARLGHPANVDPLDRGRGGHRHEEGCGHRTVGRGEHTSAGPAGAGRLELEGETGLHPGSTGALPIEG